MHSPQRMQRERKSVSPSAPGGRIARSIRFFLSTFSAPNSGTAANPDATATSTSRRLRIVPAISGGV
jgi:hypothetical protein